MIFYFIAAIVATAVLAIYYANRKQEQFAKQYTLTQSLSIAIIAFLGAFFFNFLFGLFIGTTTQTVSSQEIIEISDGNYAEIRDGNYYFKAGDKLLVKDVDYVALRSGEDATYEVFAHPSANIWLSTNDGDDTYMLTIPENSLYY